MGACATKPKALKPEAGEAPASAPEQSIEFDAGTGELSEKKVEEKEKEKTSEVEKKVEVGDDKDKEIVDDDKGGDQSSRTRSLGHLFKENEEDSTENEKTPEKLQNPEPEKVTGQEVERKLPEPEVPNTENSDIQIEKLPLPDVPNNPENVEREKPIEAAQSVDNTRQTDKTSEDTIVADKVEETYETEKTIEAVPIADAQTVETSDEKKIEVISVRVHREN